MEALLHETRTSDQQFQLAGGAVGFGPILTEITQTTEEAGFGLIGVADHVCQYPIMGGPEAEELECYATLAFLAANTRNIKLTAMVTDTHFRHPGVLAKTVTTLDVLSGRRAWFGIRVGHYKEEAHGLGIAFPPLKERFGMLEETLQICLRMWSGERGDERPFKGTHYRLERPLNLPQSLTRPHLPIMIAADGERKTLRRHCEAEGRDYDSIEKTYAFAFDVGEDGSKAGELIGQLRWLAGMGIQTTIGSVPEVHRITPLKVIGREVIPAIADL